MLKTLMPSINSLIDNNYKAIKTYETEKIIAQNFLGLTSVKNPMLLQVSGIPGSGKSTFCAKNLPKNYLFLSFDKIMVSLSSYQKDLKEKGMVEAYQNNEMVARIIGYELLNRALKAKYNIMLEHSGTNGAHLELFKNIRKKGYLTAVNFIVCDTDLAIKRADKRAEVTKRFISAQTIINRAQGLNDYVKAYQQLTPKVVVLDGANNFQVLKKI